MSNVFKFLIFLAPVTAIILFYVLFQQSKMDVELQRQEAIFEREWAEFQQAWHGKGPDSEVYVERAKEAEIRRKEAEEKLKKKEQKQEQMLQEFEQALSEVKQ